MADINWYYTDSSQKNRSGPVSQNALIQKIKSGEVAPSSFVWNGSTVNSWIPASQVETLKTHFATKKVKESDPFANSDPFEDLMQQASEPRKSSFSGEFTFDAKPQKNSKKMRAKNAKYVLPPNAELVSLGEGEQLIQIVNRLRDQGAHMEIDLPVICLCGQQSCGKSSVSESISGVPLPRASGTCTRCPTEVRMVKTDMDWEAVVSIRLEWDDQRNRAASRTSEQTIGKTKIVGEVENMVSRGQDMILQNGKLQFSRNVVVVSIRGRNCANLTIVDLPGMIFATEKVQDQRYIQLVQALVEDCIKKPNTLIAACVSAKDDMENQVINTLIRRYDPNGQRTIGIITKIDTIEEGLEDKWVEIVRGQRYALKLGYCLVKNPTQKELNMNLPYDTYRQMELDFFDQHHVWGTMDYDIKERMGSANLIKTMSGTLCDLTKVQLPKIKRKLQERMSYIQEQLVVLPPKPILRGTPKDTIMCHVLEFVDEIKEFVRSSGGAFWTESMKVFSSFFRNLEECKPRFHKNNAKVKPNKLGVKSFTIKDVMQVSKDEASRALHFSASPRARKYFLKVSTKPWSRLTTETIQNTVSVLNKTLMKLMQQHFGQYPKLAGTVKRAIDSLILEKSQIAQAEVSRLEHRETFAFTLSKANLRHVYQQAFQQLSKLFEDEVKMTMKSLQNSGESYLIEEAIMVMAESLSYYDLSYRRYADVVTMAIEHTMYREFADQVHNHLFTTLQIFENDDKRYFEALVQVSESPLVRKRIEFEDTMERLTAIMEELQTVPVNFDYMQEEQNEEDAFNAWGESTGSAEDSSFSFQTRNRELTTTEDVHPDFDEEEEEPSKKKKGKKGWFS